MKSFSCVDFNNVCFFPYSLLSFQRYLRMLHGQRQVLLRLSRWGWGLSPCEVRLEQTVHAPPLFTFRGVAVDEEDDAWYTYEYCC